MLPDVQGPMFIRDGVGPDLVRAGQPRLVRLRRRDRDVPEAALVPRRVSLFRKMLRPVTP